MNWCQWLVYWQASQEVLGIQASVLGYLGYRTSIALLIYLQQVLSVKYREFGIMSAIMEFRT